MGCVKWFLIILAILAVLAVIVVLVIRFESVALWTICGILLLIGIILAMRGKS